MPAASGWRQFVASITLRRVLISQVLALLAAGMLKPIFAPSFFVIWGRTSFISAVLLLVFYASATLPARRRSRPIHAIPVL